MSTLYRKYRPSNFSEISGQKHIIRTLTNAIKHGRIGHAYLFTGPRGTGKTTLARIFSKTINCLKPKKVKENSSKKEVIASIEPCNKCANCKLILENKSIDLIEIDAASNTGVDNIRQLKETIHIPATSLKYKVYIIDEVHMLSIGAFNALLKTLEEPPAHAIFILATTELHKVPETIISRCQRFDIARLTQDQIIERLAIIAKSEKVSIEKEALETIAIEAEGGMRDAESLLGQIISLEDKKITSQEVNEILGVSSKRIVIEFVQLLTQREIKQVLNQIDQLQSDGINLNNFNKNILSYIRKLLLIKMNPDLTSTITSLSKEQLKTSQQIIESISTEEIINLIEIFQKSLIEFKDATIPQLPLEMAAIKFNLKQNPNSGNINRSQIYNNNAPRLVKKELNQNKINKSSGEIPVKINTQEPTFQEQPPKTPIKADRKEMPEMLTKYSEEASPFSPSSPPNNSNITTSHSFQGPLPPRPAFPDSKGKGSKKNLKKNPESKRKAKNEAKNSPDLSTPISIEEVLEKWSVIVEEIKKSRPSISSVLINAIPFGIIEDKIYIKINSEYFKKKLNTNEVKLTVQQAIVTMTTVTLNVIFETERYLKNLNFKESTADRTVIHDALHVFGGRIIKESEHN